MKLNWYIVQEQSRASGLIIKECVKGSGFKLPTQRSTKAEKLPQPCAAYRLTERRCSRSIGAVYNWLQDRAWTRRTGGPLGRHTQAMWATLHPNSRKKSHASARAKVPTVCARCVMRLRKPGTEDTGDSKHCGWAEKGLKLEFWL